MYYFIQAVLRTMDEIEEDPAGIYSKLALELDATHQVDLKGTNTRMDCLLCALRDYNLASMSELRKIFLKKMATNSEFSSEIWYAYRNLDLRDDDGIAFEYWYKKKTSNWSLHQREEINPLPQEEIEELLCDLLGEENFQDPTGIIPFLIKEAKLGEEFEELYELLSKKSEELGYEEEDIDEVLNQLNPCR